eukprot:1186677-Prorocentrum_minimum.AAC.5
MSNVPILISEDLHPLAYHIPSMSSYSTSWNGHPNSPTSSHPLGNTRLRILSIGRSLGLQVSSLLHPGWPSCYRIPSKAQGDFVVDTRRSGALEQREATLNQGHYLREDVLIEMTDSNNSLYTPLVKLLLLLTNACRVRRPPGPSPDPLQNPFCRLPNVKVASPLPVPDCAKPTRSHSIETVSIVTV